MLLSEILTRINWVDVLVIILLFKTCYDGFDRGLSGEILPTIGIFATLVITLFFYHKTGAFIAQYTPISSTVSYIVCFIAIAAIIIFISHIVDNYITGRVATLHVTSFYNRLGGLIVGGMRAVLLTAMVLLALDLLPFEYIHDSIKERSLTGNIFLKAGHSIYVRTARILKLNKN